MTEILGWQIPLRPLLAVPLVAAIVAGIGLFLRKFALGFLRRWSQRTATDFDDLLVAFLEKLASPLAVLAVIFVLLNSFALPAKIVRPGNRILQAVTLGLALFFFAKLVILYVQRLAQRKEAMRNIAGPLQGVTKVVFALVGVLVVFENLGVSMTALWTTLGVGSVAIALALQDTLSNFFAGLYILVDSPIRLDDYVKLETGEEGYVQRIGWRSTRIRTLPNNVVVVPNARLSQAIVTNYFLPEKRMSLLIPIGVSYESDPVKVERLLVEETKKAAGEIPGLLAEPAPFVRFIPGFGDSSLNFTLICQVAEFVDQYLVQHELRKRIFARFQREGIEIPFPIRTVYLRTKEEAGGTQQAAT
ncbi:MAG: mechanosensitive ion channel family protein [Acidobacteria bacterium]|nr:mechanosensitive ion channel family protein [Acidobacteriota bacterium]